jgi:Zn-dependent M16 (insulinase) family peptidase
LKPELSQLNAYEIREEKRLDDIHSDGMLLVHKKSGARICVMSNEDANKVFYIAFRTPPKDSTGVPHIIEHTVLCGSKKFPVKDPFIELVKGSLNTFLNAMTYPDKTIYPVASCNDKDFQNLMDVYLDSVFSPNIYREQNIFRQEGWHYELKNPEDELTLNGVVYNEMKGAFSSADGVLDREILRSLFPDTPYSNESGGDPQVIPELTYEEYLNFHRQYYHPSNSYIYLYGDMDVVEKLNWLDQEYLSHYDKIEVDSSIPEQKPFDAPKEHEIPYSISSTDSTENNTYLSCNWAVGTNLDRELYIAFDILDYALLSTQGAPVKQALLDAGIGTDIYGGYDSSSYQPIFSIVAKHANASEQKRFEQVIRDVLQEQVKNGINKKTLLAAINGSEFKFREADFGRFPKGLMFGLQVMDSWLYDENAPFLHMEELGVYDYLRKQLDTDYFEQLIQKYLLDNTHVSYVQIVPEVGLTGKREQALKEKLQAYKATLSKEEIDQLVEETHALEKYEEEPSAKEDLEKIPLLSREDLKATSEPYKNEKEIITGVPYLWHDYQTNGIVYLDLLFDAHHISEDLIPYLGILKVLMGKLNTTDYTYTDFADEVNLYTGGVSNEVNVTGDVAHTDRYQVKYEVRLKVLEANLARGMELIKSMMLTTEFTDEKRIYEVLAQAKSRLRNELSESGHVISATRALSYYSKRAKYADSIQGIGFYEILDQVVSNYETEKNKLMEKLQEVCSLLFQRQNLLVSVTGGREGYAALRNMSDQITDGLYADTEKESIEISLPDQKNEGFKDASQIQYVSLAGNYAQSGFSYHGAMRVFKVIMNYEYLWQNIRVKGGAYGCSTNVGRNGDVCFLSYRDPNLERTLEVYRGVTDYLKEFELDERGMTRFVIGAFSELDAPLTPMSQGRRSLLSYLTGVSYEMIQKEREQALHTCPQDIRNLAETMQAVLDHSYICSIGNEGKLQEEADLFDVLKTL